MEYTKLDLIEVLQTVDLGNSVAELDTLLEEARVETSAFSDLLADRVDLIPGTKGSGKSALYRIFVDFLRDSLLAQRKVVVAHGVQSQGDPVFHVYKKRFEELTESDFIDFWCIYLVSLAHEHFIKDRRYASYLLDCPAELSALRAACATADIPEIEAKKSLKDVLDWALGALAKVNPRLSMQTLGSTYSLEFFGKAVPTETHARTDEPRLPIYVARVKDELDALLIKSNLNLWLMIDRLDEIFPRRSNLEKRALRALLKTLRIFSSPRIKIKLFLRDDILNQITETPEGFTGLTHVTSRQADSLNWSQEQILHLIVRRLFASKPLADLADINLQQLGASGHYRERAFYRIFPEKVHPGQNQSRTLRWIYNHTMDGRGVVTPRDVIDLLSTAIKRQLDEYLSESTGNASSFVSPRAIVYGHEELSKRKRDTYLKAEFPHFWKYIRNFEKGKTEYSESAALRLLQTANGEKTTEWSDKEVLRALVDIGFLQRAKHKGAVKYFKIPFIYRAGLELTQGRID